jgi:hypothetical protein
MKFGFDWVESWAIWFYISSLVLFVNAVISYCFKLRNGNIVPISPDIMYYILTHSKIINTAHSEQFQNPIEIS